MGVRRGHWVSAVMVITIVGLVGPGTDARSPVRCAGETATIVAHGEGVVLGTAGPDVIVGSPRGDTIRGLGGDDVICGRGGPDRSSGGPGDDTLRGGAGRDTLLGRRGADRLVGGPGDDRSHGGPGQDRCLGGSDRTRGCETPPALTPSPTPTVAPTPSPTPTVTPPPPGVVDDSGAPAPQSAADPEPGDVPTPTPTTETADVPVPSPTATAITVPTPRPPTPEGTTTPTEPPGPAGAVVSFTFDDGWISQATVAGPLLERYGYRGTFYLLSGVLDQFPYMSNDAATGLARAGHEIGSHTISHPHLPQLSDGDLRRELRDARTVLESRIGVPVADFASPYGEVDGRVLGEVREVYGSHRGVQEGLNARGTTDRYDIRVRNVVNTTATATVEAWMDEAMATGSWLVLVYHDVIEAPRTYDTTPAALEAHLAAARARNLAGAPVGEALSVFAAD